MPLTPGTTLGPYSVIAKIGEGGMGEVYRARDTNLDRDVAIKVLPEAFTSDPDRLARFEREAKVLASLNHPNIGAIYGLEKSGDTRALVLELVEGPTLAERIKQGPIPVDEALPIAKQIAEALEAAHEQGIIHRDLKPANIKVRTDGTVKVLDFGLAKAFAPEPTDVSASMSPTISLTAAATQMGMVIGTAAYMAPEQAKGLPVDKRADIWAYGAVLFEMLTGRKLFEASDVSEMLASVLVKDPDVSSIGDHVPAHVRSVVRQCLVKDPKERLRDIGDVRLAMKGVFKTSAPHADSPHRARPLRVWQRPLPAAVFTVLVGAVVGLTVWNLMSPSTAPPGPVRFTLTPGAAAPLRFFGFTSDVAISPDGTRIVYQGGPIGSPGAQLNLRSVDQWVSAPLRGAEGVGPFFSPDGEWVGFLDASYTTISKVSIFGGPRVELATSPSTVFGASWGADDQIIFAAAEHGLFRVPGGGGELEALTTREEDGLRHVWPSTIPNRDAVLFVQTMRSPTEDGQLAVLDLATGEMTPLGLAGLAPRYARTGHVVYGAVDGSVRAVPFDVNTLETTGNPVPLIEGVMVKGTGAINFSLSDDGRLVYVRGRTASSIGGAEGLLAFADRGGNATPFSDEERDYFRPRASPDGTRIAVEVTETAGEEAVTHIWTVPVETGVGTQLTFEGSRNRFPLWTPDGQTVVFASDRAGDGWGIYRKAADGSGNATLLFQDDGVLAPTDLSGDGVLAFHKPGPDGNGDIWTMSLESGEPPVEFLATSAGEVAARFSPDGQWMAYQLDDGDGPQVYVRPYPRTEGSQRRISEDAGRAPIWAPDGNTLYYAGLFPVPLHAASIQTTPTFSRGRPEELFVIDNGGFRTGPEIFFGPLWDITSDGERFVMVLQDATAGGGSPRDRTINVVLNWFRELTERVPVP